MMWVTSAPTIELILTSGPRARNSSTPLFNPTSRVMNNSIISGEVSFTIGVRDRSRPPLSRLADGKQNASILVASSRLG